MMRTATQHTERQKGGKKDMLTNLSESDPLVFQALGGRVAGWWCISVPQEITPPSG